MPLSSYCACLTSSTMNNGAPEQTSDATLHGSQVLNNMELTSLIFAYLKDITAQEAGIQFEEDQMPEPPASWTGLFAGLARVNRTFFHASTAVLWENLNSLEPLFGTVLPADRRGGEENELFIPLSYFAGISTQRMDRFRLYTKHTKSLRLSRTTSPEVNTPWVLYLATDNRRTQPLFPSLQRLFLTSNDNLSLLVAFLVAPTIRFISVDLDEESECEEEEEDESAVALTTLLSERATRLTSATLIHPFTTQTSSAMFGIKSLTSLNMNIISTLVEGTQLEEMKDLTLLEKLRISQNLEDPERHSTFPTSVNIQSATSRPAELDKLRDLHVSADGATQFLVASKISSRSLTHLHMEIFPAEPSTQLVVIPHAIAIHALRNTGLTSLVVETEECSANPDALVPFRGDARYNVTGSLVLGLSGLQSLTVLKFDQVPFLAVDIMSHLLVAIQTLPLLEVLWLYPKPMTDWEADELMAPSLACLKDIARHNRCLEECLLIIQDFEVEDAEAVILGGHGQHPPQSAMKRLMVVPLYAEAEDLESVDDMLGLAKYLDRLFPCLEEVREYRDGWEEANLVGVERIILSFQELRNRAMEDLADAVV
ncbi:hypothetical protein DFP72DRAFT_210969 [Ephemerocybe angulata]|uniref:Uncharacterized protein n=1 Tax=Ephemerocybe angulata TaxID=980116 RepID=A0A8H6I333_9AGAR|nr:hypothetical protein DFP72DRAFT_210969 [Tulosesus angulatus]